LQGHHSVICALQFNLAGDFLISGSSDYLIQWNIDEVTSAFASGIYKSFLCVVPRFQ